MKTMTTPGVDVRERVWQEYRDLLLRFVVARVHDRGLAEDIVHDVVVKAYARRHSLKDSTKIRPWLYQITRNALVDHYRSKKPLEELSDNLVSLDATPDETANQELTHCLRPLLGELPGMYRRAISLADLEGLSQKEIAVREGLSLSGMKSRVQRARKMLRDVLLGCCRAELDMRGSIARYEPSPGCDCCAAQAADPRGLESRPPATPRRSTHD